MSKKKKIILFLVGAATFMSAVFVISIRVYSIYGNKIVTADINNHKLYVEKVSDEEKLWKGLGGRNELCFSCGMLFEFQKAGKYSFWMKNMKFPLDLIWISQGNIVHIEKNIQPDFLGMLSPPTDADMVLEINAGNADNFEIKIGDKITF